MGLVFLSADDCTDYARAATPGYVCEATNVGVHNCIIITDEQPGCVFGIHTGITTDYGAVNP
jgi:hypothetical protein